MNDIGAYALRCACVVALYAISMALLGVRLGRQEMVRSAERATYGVFGSVGSSSSWAPAWRSGPNARRLAPGAAAPQCQGGLSQLRK